MIVRVIAALIVGGLTAIALLLDAFQNVCIVHPKDIFYVLCKYCSFL